MKKFFVIISILMITITWYGLSFFSDFWVTEMSATGFFSARVVEVLADHTVINHVGARTGTQEVSVRLLAGEDRGRVVTATNRLFPIEHSAYVQVGDRVIVFFDGADTNNYFAHVQSHDRSLMVYLSLFGFFALLAAVFGKTGIKTAFGLVFTFVVLIFLVLPLIMQGHSPAMLTVMASLIIIVVNLVAIMGYSKKTFVAVMGAFVGIGFYSLFYALLASAFRIHGFHVGQSDTLMVAGFDIGVSQLLFASILIASLGALSDVSVSLASVMAELSEKGKGMGFRETYKTGMNIGKDIIGSSSNTLILAFTGTFFVSLILFTLNRQPYHVFINRTDIVIEILRAISSSASLVLTAPATVLMGAKVFAGVHHK